MAKPNVRDQLLDLHSQLAVRAYTQDACRELIGRVVDEHYPGAIERRAKDDAARARGEHPDPSPEDLDAQHEQQLTEDIRESAEDATEPAQPRRKRTGARAARKTSRKKR